MSTVATPVVVTFKGTAPNLGAADFGLGAAVIGRASLGKDVSLGPWATLRGDGNFLEVGHINILPHNWNVYNPFFH